MPRKPNNLRTIQLTISTTQHVENYLKALVSSGLYGKNPTEAAERLVSSSIERLIREGSVLKKTPLRLREKK